MLDSVVAAMQFLYRGRWKTPLARFHRHLVRSTRRALGSTHQAAVNGSGICTSDVFPLPVPFFDAEYEGLEGSFSYLSEHPEERKSLAAARLTNLFCSWLSFYHLGCPRGQPPVVLHGGEVSCAQQHVIRRVEAEAIKFCASDGGNIAAGGRGRARLAATLAACAPVHGYGSAGP